MSTWLNPLTKHREKQRSKRVSLLRGWISRILTEKESQGRTKKDSRKGWASSRSATEAQWQMQIWVERPTALRACFNLFMPAPSLIWFLCIGTASIIVQTNVIIITFKCLKTKTAADEVIETMDLIRRYTFTSDNQSSNCYREKKDNRKSTREWYRNWS